MATPEHDYVVRGVANHLARLTPPNDWRPNVAQGRARLRELVAAQRRHRRVALAVAATLLLCVPWADVPMVRAVTQRCGEWLHVVSHGRAARPALPDVRFTDVQGRPVEISALRGKVVLLTFWTTTCGQCQTEMSWFTEFQHAYRDRNLVVLGVSLDQEGWTRVRPYLERGRINYDVVVATREAAQPIIGASIPTTLIVDRQGRIAVRHVGFCSRDEYERDLQRVLAK